MPFLVTVNVTFDPLGLAVIQSAFVTLSARRVPLALVIVTVFELVSLYPKLKLVVSAVIFGVGVFVGLGVGVLVGGFGVGVLVGFGVGVLVGLGVGVLVGRGVGVGAPFCDTVMRIV